MIGEQIKKVFEKSGMTKSEFARAAGLSRSYINKLFEKEDVSVEILKSVSDALNHDFFRDFSNEISSSSLIQEPESSNTDYKTMYLDCRQRLHQLYREKLESENKLLKELHDLYYSSNKKEESL